MLYHFSTKHSILINALTPTACHTQYAMLCAKAIQHRCKVGKVGVDKLILSCYRPVLVSRSIDVPFQPELKIDHHVGPIGSHGLVICGGVARPCYAKQGDSPTQE